jgi:hypothetical protein
MYETVLKSRQATGVDVHALGVVLAGVLLSAPACGALIRFGPAGTAGHAVGATVRTNGVAAGSLDPAGASRQATTPCTNEWLDATELPGSPMAGDSDCERVLSMSGGSQNVALPEVRPLADREGAGGGGLARATGDLFPRALGGATTGLTPRVGPEASPAAGSYFRGPPPAERVLAVVPEASTWLAGVLGLLLLLGAPTARRARPKG